MRKILFLLLTLIIAVGCQKKATFTGAVLKDKIKGGLVGQIIGNLNGIPYEEKYNNEPGTLKNYKPSLLMGAYTDDDTDIEWLHIFFMEKYKQPFLSYDTITAIWKRNMNYKTYSSNTHVRQLMELGFTPTQTSNIFLNPWSHVNVAGQFNCEMYGLVAPAMPQTAGKIGLHYTRVVINNEPAQSTQFFTAMISLAFVTDNLDSLLQAGIATLDQSTITYQATMDVIAWHKQYPEDWIRTRDEVRKKYYFITDANKSIFNHAAIVSEYLYGKGDFAKTLEIAFNWGFDADCNAATLGTILGVIKGYDWMEKQGWKIKDRYYNNARPELPMNETISSFTERLYNIATQVIAENGGKVSGEKENALFTIPVETSAVLIHPETNESLLAEIKTNYDTFTVNSFKNPEVSDHDLVKALYLSLSLKTAEQLKREYPEPWSRAVKLMQKNQDLMRAIHYSYPHYIVNIAKSTGIYPLPILPSLEGKYEFKLDGYENANAVSLGGTMNHWMTWKTPLAKEGKSWICRLNLKPGKYEYKFIVDGNWIFDPNQPKELNFEENTNSVIELK